MKRFMKGAAVNGKSGKELLTVNVNDPESHIPLKDMDIGAETARVSSKNERHIYSDDFISSKESSP